MNLDALFHLFKEARTPSGHQDYVVIGSLSVLGLEEGFAIPEAMTMSNDVDCYTKSDPQRIFDMVKALGENSPFHAEYGFYLDAISPQLPSLPDGWAERLMKKETVCAPGFSTPTMPPFQNTPAASRAIDDGFKPGSWPASSPCRLSMRVSQARIFMTATKRTERAC